MCDAINLTGVTYECSVQLVTELYLDRCARDLPLPEPPASVVRYTNRPLGRRRRNTKRLTVLQITIFTRT